MSQKPSRKNISLQFKMPDKFSLFLKSSSVEISMIYDKKWIDTNLHIKVGWKEVLCAVFPLWRNKNERLKNAEI